jgi:hypothetical protein
MAVTAAGPVSGRKPGTGPETGIPHEPADRSVCWPEAETPTVSAIDCTLTITKCRASLTSHPVRLPDTTCGREHAQHRVLQKCEAASGDDQADALRDEPETEDQVPTMIIWSVRVGIQVLNLPGTPASGRT